MHASDTDLALYAGKDLGFWAGWRIARHVRACSECRFKVQTYQANRIVLQHSAELPAGMDWDRLSAEMSANIRLGLVAGECVAPRRQTAELTGWRPAAVLAGVALVVTLAWFANSKVPALTPNLAKLPAQQGLSVQASATGIELNDHGRVLVLQHPKDTENSPVTLSMTLNTVRARYVDSESGQVTINNVYVQ